VVRVEERSDVNKVLGLGNCARAASHGTSMPDPGGRQYVPVQMPDAVTWNFMNKWLNLSTRPKSTYIPAPARAVTFGKVKEERTTAAAPASRIAAVSSGNSKQTRRK
ncbi:MAG: hypothetical protein JWQ75_599, partial [Pseudarthrobacter sp.]|nr:hypothetical protein [Pseudarthrobacter sp.]